MASQQSKKNLRIGVFRGKNTIEERVVKKHSDISFGKTAGNTFQIPSASFADSLNVFLYDDRTGQYTLEVPKGTKGRVVLKEGKSINLENAQLDENVKSYNGVLSVRLTDTARGKVTFGKITVLFQFVSSKEDAGALLYAGKQNLDFKLTDVVSIGFLIPLILSAILHVGFLVYVIVQDWPRNDETIAVPQWFKEALVKSSIDTVDDEPKPPEPEPIEDPYADPVDSGEIEPTPDIADNSGASKAELMESITDAHREQGAMITAQILGIDSGGDAGDYFGSMLGSSAAIADMSDVSAADIGVGGTGGLLNSLAASSNSGSGNGLMNIGDGSSGGPRVVTNDNKQNTQRAKVDFKMTDNSEFTASAAPGSKDAINAVFKKKSGDIQNCYKRVIASQGKVSGKLVLLISLKKDGTVQSVDKKEDQIGGEMFTCVRQRIMNWKFSSMDKPISFKKTWVFN